MAEKKDDKIKDTTENTPDSNDKGAETTSAKGAETKPSKGVINDIQGKIETEMKTDSSDETGKMPNLKLVSPDNSEKKKTEETKGKSKKKSNYASPFSPPNFPEEPKAPPTFDEHVEENFKALEGKKYDVVCLYSGGLDSLLAVKIMTGMKLKVLALKMILPFDGELEERGPIIGRNRKVGCDLLQWHTDVHFIDLIKKPEHGHGKNMNPCIDCKIHFNTIARLVMEKVGAQAVVTGDVLGQRPMSQNKDSMNVIMKKAGLKGKMLRPLTALNLDETEIEKSGKVDRSKLFDFNGRGRKPQMELAEKLGIKKYESPAGGCLLTDPGYSHRLKESFEKEEDGVLYMQLLRYGRHFRLPGGSKLILGRNDEENAKLKKMFPGKWVKFDGIETKGPWAGIQGTASLYDLKLAAQIWARYSQGRDIDPLEMRLIYPKNKKQILITHPLKIGQEAPYLIVNETQEEE